MSKPEFGIEEDLDSMFDFLSEDGNRPRARRPDPSSKGQRQLPVIRKPVPVSESGPLLPPKPGDPVEPPRQQTMGKGDEFDFLCGEPPAMPHLDDSDDRTMLRTVTRSKADHKQPSKPEQVDSVEYFQSDFEQTRLKSAARMPAAPGN